MSVRRRGFGDDYGATGARVLGGLSQGEGARVSQLRGLFKGSQPSGSGSQIQSYRFTVTTSFIIDPDDIGGGWQALGTGHEAFFGPTDFEIDWDDAPVIETDSGPDQVWGYRLDVFLSASSPSDGFIEVTTLLADGDESLFIPVGGGSSFQIIGQPRNADDTDQFSLKARHVDAAGSVTGTPLVEGPFGGHRLITDIGPLLFAS